MNVVRKWTRVTGDTTWYWVEHIRDGKTVFSYSNYADPCATIAESIDRGEGLPWWAKRTEA